MDERNKDEEQGVKKKKYIINSINFHQIPKNPRYRNGIGDLYIYASEI